MGEREARVLCPLVRHRHLGMAHGIGRSGDVAAEQPKAAGSSLILALTTRLAADALREAGLVEVADVVVLPAATGVALMLTFLALRARRPGTANVVIWSRIDQKTCIKAILSAGFDVRVVSPILVGDQLETDVDGMARAVVDAGGPDQVICAVTTTSCFAPRGCDDVESVAKLCRHIGIAHVINHAYGVQSAWLCAEVTRAARRGVVSACVQSTDKNFLVPVGGALIADFKGDDGGTVGGVRSLYPGRAAMTPVLDLCQTLLYLGRDGWARIREERMEVFGYLRDALRKLAERTGQKLLETPRNPISVAFTLNGFDDGKTATQLGSRLFVRLVSGARVVAPKTQTVGNVTLTGFGAHHDAYPHTYITAAAGLGATRKDVDLFVARLEKELLQPRTSTTNETS